MRMAREIFEHFFASLKVISSSLAATLLWPHASKGIFQRGRGGSSALLWYGGEVTLNVVYEFPVHLADP